MNINFKVIGSFFWEWIKILFYFLRLKLLSYEDIELENIAFRSQLSIFQRGFKF